MPTATILVPREGDTVRADRVAIIVSFAGFTASTELKCKIATEADPPESVQDTGIHRGHPRNSVPTGYQTVKVWSESEDTPLSQEDNVLVVSGDPPVSIEETIPEDGKRKKIKKVKGDVPNGSAASYVVVQVFEVDAKTGRFTIKAAGAATVERRMWKVDLDVDVRAEPGFQYVARAFVYTRDQRLIGSASEVVKK
jgi:hypothetical protein